MASLSEMEVLFEIEGVDEALVVHSVRGREAVSELFAFAVGVTTEDASFDFASCVGKSATLTFRSDGHERYVRGLVSRFEHPRTKSLSPVYEALLVPHVALLDLRRDCRTYQGLTVPEIVSQVLQRHTITDVQTRLLATYDKRDVVVQYRESDWAFISRLLESEGIHCYFEHTATADTLVLSDAETVHDPIDGEDPLPFRPSGQGLHVDEGVESFGLARQLLSPRLTVRDYPSGNLRTATEETAAEEGAGDVLDHYDFPGTRAAQRLTSLAATRNRAAGEARSLRLLPGRCFTLQEHPRDDFDVAYFLTRVEHEVTTSEKGLTYGVTFECIPASQPYRPERKTPCPNIGGIQSAQVVGPEGTEIHVDEYGRVLVQFHWDREPAGSTASACWLPVSHHAASAGHGAVHLPRVGDSVLVEFLDGDPDRPLVTGRIYSAFNTHPYSLPANATKAVFRDASTPGGGGYNELTFDSAAGSEEVYLRAQRNLRAEVQNDAQRTVGQDDTLSVDRNRTVEIGGQRTVSVAEDDALTIGGAQTISVEGSRSVSVTGDRTEQIGGASQRIIVGDATEGVGGNRSASVSGSETLETTGDHSHTVGGARTAAITGNDSTTVTGNRIESVTGNVQQVVDGLTSMYHGSLSLVVSGNTAMQFTGENLMESQIVHKIGAPKVYVSASSKLYLRAGEEIILEVGDSTLTVKDGEVYVTNGGSTKTLSGDTVYFNC